MIVMKFGGSSVANAERIKHVASIIQAYAEKRPAVVLSAMGDTTDHLLEAADLAVQGKVDIEKVEKLHFDTAKELGIDVPAIKELLDELKTLLTGISMLHELTRRTRDYLVSFGERMSVRMMAAYLQKQGTSAKFYDAWDIGMVSDSNYMSAELLDEVVEEKQIGVLAGESVQLEGLVDVFYLLGDCLELEVVAMDVVELMGQIGINVCRRVGEEGDGEVVCQRGVVEDEGLVVVGEGGEGEFVVLRGEGSQGVDDDADGGGGIQSERIVGYNLHVEHVGVLMAATSLLVRIKMVMSLAATPLSINAFTDS